MAAILLYYSFIYCLLFHGESRPKSSKEFILILVWNIIFCLDQGFYMLSSLCILHISAEL